MKNFKGVAKLSWWFLCDHLPTTRMNDEIMQQNSNRLRSMYGMSPMNLNTPTTYNNTYVKMSIKISLHVYVCALCSS